MIRHKTILLVAIFTLSVMSVSAALAAPKVDTIATISSVEGDVQVRKGDEGEWVPAKEGTAVSAGYQIKTGAKSSCAIEWSQGNVVKITSFTNIKLDRLEKNLAAGSESSSLDLWTGKLYAKAKNLESPSSTFQIKTPSAIAGVRGTRFSVGVDADETTSVECLDGVVHVESKAGGEVMLQKNQKTSVKKDQEPSEPVQMESEDEEAFEELEEAVGATLEIMQPVGNLETEVSPVTVKGKTDPGNTVTVNGQAVTADESGVFTASIDLEEGVNHIKIEAANRHGNVTTKTRVIKYGKKAEEEKEAEPEEQAINLTVTSPRDGLVTRESTLTVTGKVEPNAGLAVNGISAAVSEAGTFSATVTLIEGENTITVTGEKGDLSQTVTRTVFKDTTAPRLIISQPSASFGLGSGGCQLVGSSIQCIVMGQTEPDSILTINNTRYQVEPDGSFAHTITLSFDEPTISIASTDSVGNRTTTVLNRVIERNAVEYLEISISPGSITANGQDTATVTVRAYNLLREPVEATVSLSATYGGTLSSSTLITSGGTASATFTAGVGGIQTTVTLTATSGLISSSATLLLNADVPPEH